MLGAIAHKVFKSISQLDVNDLLNLSLEEIRPLLPVLVRMSLCAPLNTSEDWKLKKKQFIQILSGIDAVNRIILFLQVQDFDKLQDDAVKDHRLQLKQSGLNKQKPPISVIKFEQSEPNIQLQLVISEILKVHSWIEAGDYNQLLKYESELFASQAYLQEVSDVLCILCAELPSLMKIETVVQSLIFLPHGVKVLCKLVANNPSSFLPVCSIILQINPGYVTNNDVASHLTMAQITKIDKVRFDMIVSLCTMNKDSALAVRKLCVNHCQLPEAAIYLTLNYNGSVLDENSLSTTKAVNNLVVFVSGLLLGSDLQVRSWFASYVRHSKDATSENPLRKHLLQELIQVVKSSEIKTDNDSQSSDLNSDHNLSMKCESMYLLLDEQCVRASALIRLYCAMKAIAGVKFTSDESKHLLLLITCFPPLTPAGIKFVSLALGMLLACPILITSDEDEKKVISWVKWLAIKCSEIERVGSEGCSFAEQLLLTAIHLHGDRRSAAVKLANSTLGMRIKVSSSSLMKIKHIFTQEVFPTQVVAAHAMKVPITRDLNANINGYLPIHCVFQLLKSRAFSQGKIDVKFWIYQQLCSTSSPLHPQLQPLVSQYVSTLVNPSSKSNLTVHDNTFNKPFTEEEIIQVFDDNKGYSFTSKLLILYYVLLYEDSVLNSMKQIALHPNKPSRYPSSLINSIPVKLLIYKAQRQPAACQGLYPGLIGLLTTQLPHLCLAEDWMQDLDSFSSMFSCYPLSEFKRSRQKSEEKSPEHLYGSLKRASVNPAPALMHLRMLSHQEAEADHVILYADALAKGLPFLLNDKVSRRVRQEALKLWLKINSFIPRKLWVLTTNALMPATVNPILEGVEVKSNTSLISYDDLTSRPLLPLSVHRKVLQSPIFLTIILRILSACLSAFQSQIIVMLKANPTVNEKNNASSRSASPIINSQIGTAEKDELRSALVSAQKSAAVQLLIEICESDRNKNQDDMTVDLLTSKREVQCLICSAVHQIFIADPSVAKLVHFQVLTLTLF